MIITVNEKRDFQLSRGENHWHLDNHQADYDIAWLPNGMISILYKGKSYTVIADKTDFVNKELVFRINGQTYTAVVKEPIDQLLSSMGMDLNAMQRAEPVKAPMPGMVLRILVTPGQQIRKGDGLLILEAMKMENVLKATADGIVKTIKAVEKTAVEKGATLIEME